MEITQQHGELKNNWKTHILETVETIETHAQLYEYILQNNK